MPWEVQSRDGKYCVVKQSDGSTVHCHDTREQAIAQMRALYASEGKSFTYLDIESEGQLPMSEPDVFVYYGGAVKALGDGKVGGYLVEFSDPETKTGSPDLDRDYFAADTDYDLEENKSATVYYDHGRDPVLKRRKLGRVAMRVDDVGVWVEGQLNRRDEHEKAIYRLAELGKLGWSSGTAPHLVDRKSVGNFKKIVSWPLGDDASLTPTPASYTKTNQVVALKSVAVPTLAEMVAEVLKPEPEVKATPISIPTLDAITAPAAKATIDEYSDSVVTAVDGLTQHAEGMVGALKAYSSALGDKQEFRWVKDGRTISKATLTRIKQLRERIAKASAAITECDTELGDIEKTAELTKSHSDAIDEAARFEFLRYQQLTKPKELTNA